MGQNSIEEQQQDWRIPESTPRLKKGQIVESPGNKIIVTKAGQWIGMALCTAVLAGGALEQLISNRPANAGTFAPDWLPFAAA